ncbi:hypothetical protein GCM10010145_05080 [Streptomyces ruber]|uniref:Uncharacterized protein n=2 Tax=Streptomyces TaxID=1883 RepID=A0A918B704_9ACTN|nr:hypothetical protein GCM10010145_05080 [Streptomyces ruber]
MTPNMAGVSHGGTTLRFRLSGDGTDRSGVAVEEGVDGQVEGDADGLRDRYALAAPEAPGRAVPPADGILVQQHLAVLAVDHDVDRDAGLGVALHLGAEVVGPVRGRHLDDRPEDVRGVAVPLDEGITKVLVDDREVGDRVVVGHGRQPEADALDASQSHVLDLRVVERLDQPSQRQRMRAVRRRCRSEPPLENLHAVPRQCTGEQVGGFTQRQLVLQYSHGVLLFRGSPP